MYLCVAMGTWLHSQTETDRKASVYTQTESVSRSFFHFLNWIKETSHPLSPVGVDKSEGRQ